MEAQKLLDNAMFYERRRNWKKAIQCYEDLQKVLKEDSFQKLCVGAQDKMQILQFQCYFHCAVAYQKLGEHEKAIALYEEAIKTLQKTKNGCRVGCITGKNMHWCVPAYAMKTLSEIHLGNLNEAHRTIESALVLDVSNPDTLCIRALVRFLLGRREKAIADVTQANKMNPSHVCSLLLRSLFVKRDEYAGLTGLHKNREWSRDEEKAYEINPSVVAYYGCTDIKAKFIEIFERYLPTIRCSHTVTVYDVLQTSQARSQDKDTRGARGRTGATGYISRTRSKAAGHSTKPTSTSYPPNTEISNINFRTGTTTVTKTTSGVPKSVRRSDNECLEDNSSKQGMETMGKQDTKVFQTECCKQCSTMEGFLKHLIHGDTTLSKRKKSENRTGRRGSDSEDEEVVRMYPRPWTMDQQFTTLPANFSTRNLKKTKDL